MGGHRFDVLIRSLSGSRRSLFPAVLAGGWLGAPDAEARPKRRNQRPRFNQDRCLDVGEKCYGKDASCCSGICGGAGKRSRCVAHHQSTCSGDVAVCQDPDTCRQNGSCFQTTGKAGFCGIGTLRTCAPCQQDRDCETEFGPGAACVVCGQSCVGVNGSSGTACVPAAP